jgi:hypothetical protein
VISADVYQRVEEGVYNFKKISAALSKIWKYSWMPVIIGKETFAELSCANELALRIIQEQYREGYYENQSHPFTEKVKELDDPEISIVPFRIDYLKKENGTYAMYDLNTQPGIPGSYFWEEFLKSDREKTFSIDGVDFEFFSIFQVLGEIFNGFSSGLAEVALFQERDHMMDNQVVEGLSNICDKTSSYGHYEIKFVQDNAKLEDFDVIEPFYFIRGDMAKVFLNYETALKENKPLGSNLKLEPYTSKDMAFARNVDSYLGSTDSEFLNDRIAAVSENGGVKKRLYGMSGTGFYEGDDSLPWSDELINQEELFPEECLVSDAGKLRKMMYDIGITSLMVFKGRDLAEFNPVVDITVRARECHPISGPDTNVVPAAVEK